MGNTRAIYPQTEKGDGGMMMAGTDFRTTTVGMRRLWCLHTKDKRATISRKPELLLLEEIASHHNIMI